MNRFEQIVQQISKDDFNSEEKPKSEEGSLKYFLVFSHGAAREDYSVYYSTLVIAIDKTNAIAKYCANFPNVKPADFGDDESFSYGIEEFTPIV